MGRRLKISQREPIDAESQGLAGDATVVVVAGADKTQLDVRALGASCAGALLGQVRHAQALALLR